VIREVTEPTSPDPYYAEQKMQKTANSANPTPHALSAEQLGAPYLNADQQEYESPSKSDLMKKTSQGASH